MLLDVTLVSQGNRPRAGRRDVYNKILRNAVRAHTQPQFPLVSRSDNRQGEMSDPDSIPQITSSGSTNTPPRDFLVMPLDPSLYKLEEDEATFFKQATGIPDDEELKQHILRVQADAYEVHFFITLAGLWTTY